MRDAGDVTVTSMGTGGAEMVVVGGRFVPWPRLKPYVRTVTTVRADYYRMGNQSGSRTWSEVS